MRRYGVRVLRSGFFSGLMLGLLTRFFAAMSIETAYPTFIHAGTEGYDRGGYEYVLMWGMPAFAILLRGGGNCSLDRVIRCEL